MKARWRLPLGVLLFTAALAPGQSPRLGGPIVPVGYLLPDSQSKAVPYQPQPGDIVLYDDFNRFHKVVFRLAGTSAPSHAAMVIARADGAPALLDLTGPMVVTAKVCIIDVEPRLSSYPGVIMIRRLREPLTPEQSQELTRFAEAESGKSFALGRVCLQGTPFCARTGLRREMFGKTYPSRKRWFCSELVVAACASAHVLDANKCCANATFPRDLAFDERMDLSELYHPASFWTAAPPR